MMILPSFTSKRPFLTRSTPYQHRLAMSPHRSVRFAPDTIPTLDQCISSLCNSHLSPLSPRDRQQRIVYLIKGFKRSQREFHEALEEQARPTKQPDLPVRRLQAVLLFHLSQLDPNQAVLQRKGLSDVLDYLSMTLEFMNGNEEEELTYSEATPARTESPTYSTAEAYQIERIVSALSDPPQYGDVPSVPQSAAPERPRKHKMQLIGRVRRLCRT